MKNFLIGFFAGAATSLAISLLVSVGGKTAVAPVDCSEIIAAQASIDSLDAIIYDLRQKRQANSAQLIESDSIYVLKIDSVRSLPASEQTQMFAENYAGRQDSISGDLSDDELDAGIRSANEAWIKLEGAERAVELLKVDIIDANKMIADLELRSKNMQVIIDDLTRDNANLTADKEWLERKVHREQVKTVLVGAAGVLLVVLVAI